MEYTYLTEISGEKVTLNIAAPTPTNPLYKVTHEGQSLGCLFNELNYEQEVVWRSSTTKLKGLAAEIGDFISRTDEQIMQE
jgi:hypothetical protein